MTGVEIAADLDTTSVCERMCSDVTVEFDCEASMRASQSGFSESKAGTSRAIEKSESSKKIMEMLGNIYLVHSKNLTNFLLSLGWSKWFIVYPPKSKKVKNKK